MVKGSDERAAKRTHAATSASTTARAIALGCTPE
jgi:hypothetical protein